MVLKPMNIDNGNSNVSFSIKKLGLLTIKGSLSDLKGDVFFDKNDLENSNFNVSVSPVTINTSNNKRDEHLKSTDFFHVKKFPKISFQSTSVQKNGDMYLAQGKLSILSTTQDLTIPFKYSDNSFSGSLSINRFDFELGKKFPAFIVGKTVQININCKIKE